jgi:hypothetical protein
VLNFRQNRNSLPMSFLRYFALFLLLALAVLLTGALGSRPSDSSQAAPLPETCAAAVHALDEAIARLDPVRVTWMESTLWQRATLGHVTYKAAGRYLTAPNHRFRLELTTRQGEGTTTYLAIGDGKANWEGIHTGKGPWQPVARDDVRQSFAGVLSFLQSLRACMTWTNREMVRRQGRVFLKLTGSMSDSPADVLFPADQSWSRGPLRESRLYLDAQTLWPHRVEWWGRPTARDSKALLVEMEFRDPRFNQPLSDERCAMEFGFPNRAREFLAQQDSAR